MTKGRRQRDVVDDVAGIRHRTRIGRDNSSSNASNVVSHGPDSMQFNALIDHGCRTRGCFPLRGAITHRRPATRIKRICAQRMPVEETIRDPTRDSIRMNS